MLNAKCYRDHLLRSPIVISSLSITGCCSDILTPDASISWQQLEEKCCDKQGQSLLFPINHIGPLLNYKIAGKPQPLNLLLSGVLSHDVVAIALPRLQKTWREWIGRVGNSQHVGQMTHTEAHWLPHWLFVNSYSVPAVTVKKSFIRPPPHPRWSCVSKGHIASTIIWHSLIRWILPSVHPVDFLLCLLQEKSCGSVVDSGFNS